MRQLWALWTGLLFSMATTSVIILGVLPRIMKSPLRPPEEPFLRWVQRGFFVLVLGTWAFGLWAVRQARRLRGATGLPPTPPPEVRTPAESPVVSWALAGWSALEGGLLVDLVYWLLSQDWGNTLPALLIHGLTFLGLNPVYIGGSDHPPSSS